MLRNDKKGYQRAASFSLVKRAINTVVRFF